MTNTAASIDRAALLQGIANLSSRNFVAPTLSFQCQSCNAFPFENREELAEHQHECIGHRSQPRGFQGTKYAFPGSPTTPATEKQVAFLRKLVAERCPDASEEFIQEVLAQGKQRVSKAISNLLAKPVVKAPEAAQKAPKVTVEVPDGNYALEDEDGTVRFYTVSSPTEGKWAGFTFVSIHASDERYPVKGAARANVLKLIAADPKEAAVRYGHETNHCSRCGKELTDASSRAAGIGPKCSAKLGWDN